MCQRKCVSILVVVFIFSASTGYAKRQGDIKTVHLNKMILKKATRSISSPPISLQNFQLKQTNIAQIEKYMADGNRWMHQIPMQKWRKSFVFVCCRCFCGYLKFCSNGVIHFMSQEAGDFVFIAFICFIFILAQSMCQCHFTHLPHLIMCMLNGFADRIKMLPNFTSSWNLDADAKAELKRANMITQSHSRVNS